MSKGLTPQQRTEKQIKNAKANLDSFKNGALAVQVAPNKKAADAQDKYLANVQAAVDSGRFKDGNNAVSLSDWQDAMTTKGAQNFGPGLDRAKDKILAFHEQFDPYQQSVANRVNAMPNDTESDRDAKMLANAAALRNFKYKKR